MATYRNGIHLDGPWYRTCGEHLCWKETTSRTYANGDIILGPHLARGTMIKDSIVANSEVDSNAAPTATGVLELVKSGETPVVLVNVAAATLGVDDGITRGNTQAGVAHVVPSAGWYVQFRFTAAFATQKAGTMRFGLDLSGHVPSVGGDPTAPTG